MNEFHDWLTATLASDANEGQGVVSDTIRPLFVDTSIVGPARVLIMSRDDNLAVREFLNGKPLPGCIVIAAGGSVSRTATIGGLLATEMQLAGVASLITDGLVRDSREIRELRFPVWCRGVTPIASQKNGPAIVGGPVSIGGVIVHDDDLVIADEDGVVIWPQARIDELLERARKRFELDEQRLAAIKRKGTPSA
jgi:4-hydroxy-4-methyl-2-oxoglutarate aldolase